MWAPDELGPDGVTGRRDGQTVMSVVQAQGLPGWWRTQPRPRLPGMC